MTTLDLKNPPGNRVYIPTQEEIDQKVPIRVAGMKLSPATRDLMDKVKAFQNSTEPEEDDNFIQSAMQKLPSMESYSPGTSVKSSDQEPKPPMVEDTPKTEERVRYSNNWYDNPKMRKSVEVTASELRLEDIFRTNRLEQAVNVTDNVEVVFRSLTQSDSMFILHMLSTYAAEKGESYANSVATSLALAVSVVRINSTVLKVVDPKRADAEEVFKHNLEYLLDLNSAMLAILQVNFGWFSDRVESLYEMDCAALKNG